MRAEDYDAWYDSPRGHWIADTEYALLCEHLQPQAGDTLLDIGSGTGQFTRLFAAARTGPVIGLDPNLAWLQYAAMKRAHDERFVAGDATALPFSDRSVDLTVSVTALCFVRDQRRAVSELVRVTRRRFAVGLLNRRSTLYFQKGRHGGTGAYRGAHWHTASEARALFAGQPVRNLRTQTALASTRGGPVARLLEKTLPSSWPWGAFLVVSGDIAPQEAGRDPTGTTITTKNTDEESPCSSNNWRARNRPSLTSSAAAAKAWHSRWTSSPGMNSGSSTRRRRPR